jgi:hypothetical protein
LVRTTDGGRSFVSVDTGLPAVQWVQFLSTSLGWVSGPSGIAVTYDGGARWSRQLSFPAGTFDGAQPPAPDFWKSQVGFRDSLHGFAYYHSVWTVMNQSAGVLYYTADGGGTWRGMTCTCGYIPIPDSALLGAKHGLPGAFVEGDLDVTGTDSASFVQSEAIMDRTSVCTTYSAGSTWSCSYLPFAKSAPGRIASIGSTRWLVLREPGLDKAIIATSGDAGLSWVVRTTISE